MTAPPDFKDLKLSVTNFGPITKADIDLRPMTVFVGPSNTGKSYMAMLVYALHGFFSGKVIRPAFHLAYGSRTIFGFDPTSEDDEAISSEDIDALIDWFSRSGTETGIGDPVEAVPTVLTDSVRKLVRPWLEGIDAHDRALDTEIARCFGVEDSSS